MLSSRDPVTSILLLFSQCFRTRSSPSICQSFITFNNVLNVSSFFSPTIASLLLCQSAGPIRVALLSFSWISVNWGRDSFGIRRSTSFQRSLPPGNPPENLTL
eukprot:Protomagalhaensia_wolfi_Nauph_80__3224@NODE_3283_length_839_cov_2_500000_g2575_i0_p3_GENE_NODE_3283_length_839_cov_2_500000_g2575_i0NODE_3283_length_839_cov_2_500000_g2575_i0_p3_ORF_typecomplete_len103_score3_66DUF4504/PF14953_6/0_07_NODE_3283_length_839_cov_2_500000_g2575_i0280588